MFSKIKFTSVVLAFIGVLIQTLLITPTQSFVYAKDKASSSIQDFDQFIKSIGTGKADDVVGVYVPGVFTARVVQQPANNSTYVSPVNGVVTEFSLPKSYGNIGLLAHNYLTGAEFSKLSIGQEIRIVLGDGQVEYFVVDEILQYQALQPDNAFSVLIDLDTRKPAASSSVFKRAYIGERRLTLQTCIYANGNPNWGRLFVIAVPKQ